MIPKRVTLENFLSFGEKQEIVFEEDHILWIIGGPNGSGKSTVFDAMTYCLFGTHRASGTRIKESDNHLIRHGCGGFQIGFEFEFQGIDYRIVRSRNRGSKRQPTPTVERRTREGKWERIPHVN
ncbi:MAG TPA: AAA family ATPase, partial [Gemmatales bacterium]|nr:AAA family ATPase [Gemmatales bacterium]